MRILVCTDAFYVPLPMTKDCLDQARRLVPFARALCMAFFKDFGELPTRIYVGQWPSFDPNQSWYAEVSNV